MNAGRDDGQPVPLRHRSRRRHHERDARVAGASPGARLPVRDLRGARPPGAPRGDPTDHLVPRRSRRPSHRAPLDGLRRIRRRARASGPQDPGLPQHHTREILRRRVPPTIRAARPPAAPPIRATRCRGGRSVGLQPTRTDQSGLPASLGDPDEDVRRSNHRSPPCSIHEGLALRRTTRPEQAPDRARRGVRPSSAHRSYGPPPPHRRCVVRAIRDPARAADPQLGPRSPRATPRQGVRCTARRGLSASRRVRLSQRTRGLRRAAPRGHGLRPAGRRAGGWRDTGDDGRRRRAAAR